MAVVISEEDSNFNICSMLSWTVILETPLMNGPLTYIFWKYGMKSVGSEILVHNGNI